MKYSFIVLLLFGSLARKMAKGKLANSSPEIYMNAPHPGLAIANGSNINLFHFSISF